MQRLNVCLLMCCIHFISLKSIELTLSSFQLPWQINKYIRVIYAINLVAFLLQVLKYGSFFFAAVYYGAFVLW